MHIHIYEPQCTTNIRYLKTVQTLGAWRVELSDTRYPMYIPTDDLVSKCHNKDLAAAVDATVRNFQGDFFSEAESNEEDQNR